MSENLTLSPDETQTLKEFLNLARALKDSLSTEFIVKTAGSLGELMPLLDLLQDKEMHTLLVTLSDSAGNLSEILKLINEYYTSGALNSALELIALLGAVKNALTTESVAKMAENLSSAMVIGDKVTAQVGRLGEVQTLLDAAKYASKEAEADTGKIGIYGLLKMIGEPEVQKGLKFMMYFLKKL